VTVLVKVVVMEPRRDVVDVIVTPGRVIVEVTVTVGQGVENVNVPMVLVGLTVANVNVGREVRIKLMAGWA
jgi:hypothetical protein